MDVIDVIQDVLCLSLLGTELLDMADDLSHLLYSFANYSNHYAIITVLLCFVATAVLILRFNNDLLHFPMLPPSPPNTAVKMPMRGFTNPFSITLKDAATTTLKDGFSLSVSSLTEGHLSVFWGTSINTVHEVLQWSPETILKDLNGGHLLQGEESLHSQQNIRLEKHGVLRFQCPGDVSEVTLGHPPRQRYPCVVIAATSGGDLGTPAVVASFTMLHLRDSVVTMDSQSVGQYLKLSDGRVFNLQALYLATDNEDPSLSTSSPTSPQTSTQTSPQTSPQTNPQTSTQTSPQTSTQTSTQTSPQTSPQTSTQTSTQTSPQTSPQTTPQTTPQTSTQTSTHHGQLSCSLKDTVLNPSVEPCLSCSQAEVSDITNLDGSGREENETTLSEKSEHLTPCRNKHNSSCDSSSTEVQSVFVSSSMEGGGESSKTDTEQRQSITADDSDIEPRVSTELSTEASENDRSTVSSSTSDMDGDGHECVVCQMNPISHVILPCRHACACSMCFKKIDRCPMCRGFIGTYFTLFDDELCGEVSPVQEEAGAEQTGFVAWIGNMNDRLNEYLGFT
ncbi:cell growth regulator with RING finger domain protein 1-like [Haliotis rufescens]|uniref:cell growth regulator with RING finger domain protein 1-like n=1 Tax=Haliotis rufescens TaxID=6454 RepID=UPI00201EB195|nr:cell growth regulator with RING finger domain protein 1-like [Haliotis rufescens]